MHYRQLGNTGLEVSILGFGGAPLGGKDGGAYGGFDEASAISALHRAFDLGVNLIDTSPYYGVTESETFLGKALKGINRDDYIMATKVGRYDFDLFDFSAERVTRSVDESLQRLGLEHIDILQVHDIEFGNIQQVVDETLPALRKLQQDGKVRFLGVTGLPLNIYKKVLDQTDLDVILSYCHYSLNDNTLETLIPYLKEKQVGVINASPLSMALLSEGGPPEWHPASEAIKTTCKEAVQFCLERGSSLRELALQFSTSNPDISCTVVGMQRPEFIESNVATLEKPVNTELLKEVQAILAPIHNQTWPSGLSENN